MSKKKIFPKIKKKLNNFLTSESGKITKKDALGISAAIVLGTAVSDTFAAHTSHTNASGGAGGGSGHSSYAHGNSLSCGASNHTSNLTGHYSRNGTFSASSTTPHSSSHSPGGLSGHGSGTGHSSHGSHSNVIDEGPCFTFTQRVLTVDGYKPIGTLNVGDEVISYNHETNEYETSVIRFFIIHDGVYSNFTDYSDVYLIKIYVLSEDGDINSIETTDNHSFYDPVLKDYKKICDFAIGDDLFLYKNKGKLIKKEVIITDKNGENKDLPVVYNLHMEELHHHNYFVEGCLVHNAEGVEITK